MKAAVAGVAPGRTAERVVVWVPSILVSFTRVTRKVAVVWPGAKARVAGTVAAVGSLEAREKVSVVAGGAPRVSVAVAAGALSEMLAGATVKVSAGVSSSARVSVVLPGRRLEPVGGVAEMMMSREPSKRVSSMGVAVKATEVWPAGSVSEAGRPSLAGAVEERVKMVSPGRDEGRLRVPERGASDSAAVAGRVRVGVTTGAAVTERSSRAMPS